MPEPFPGMDPFLELYWEDIHSRLAVYAANEIQPQLPRELRARIEESVAISEDDEPLTRFRPDTWVGARPGNAATGGTETAVALAEVETAEPHLVPIEDEALTARTVKIVDRTGGQVVTSIEFLSPHNKLTERSRELFRRKQELLLAGGVNIVEIDLVRQGGWARSVREPRRPQSWSDPYRVCVVRAIRKSFAECYDLPLQQRLPAIRIPLRPLDDDVALDLQRLIDAAWRDGGYSHADRRLNELPPYSEADAAWIRQRIASMEQPAEQAGDAT